MRRSIPLTFVLLAFGGCAANHVGVTPSQNRSLSTVSPSTTAASEGGIMQHSLDNWLKEEWTPLASPAADGASPTATSPDAPEKNDGSKPFAATAPEPQDNSPFTLQKYADKWKTYLENKEKMKEGKPKETSNIEKIEKLPVIGR